MENVIKKVKANAPVLSVLTELTNVTDANIENAPVLVDDTDFNHSAIWISSKLTIGGIESTVATGGLYFIFQRIADTDERRTIEENMVDDLGVSKTQLYRCVDVWKRFGKLLIEEPNLKAYFVVEALKRLSAASVDPMAREAAITMARRREKVRINHADDLIAKFSPDADIPTDEAVPTVDTPADSPSQTVKKRSVSSLWKYAGEAINLLLQPAKAKADVDHEAIIRDLEAALALYRKQFAQAQQQRTPKLKRPNKQKGQVSHV